MTAADGCPRCAHVDEQLTAFRRLDATRDVTSPEAAVAAIGDVPRGTTAVATLTTRHGLVAVRHHDTPTGVLDARTAVRDALTSGAAAAVIVRGVQPASPAEATVNAQLADAHRLLGVRPLDVVTHRPRGTWVSAARDDQLCGDRELRYTPLPDREVADPPPVWRPASDEHAELCPPCWLDHHRLRGITVPAGTRAVCPDDVADLLGPLLDRSDRERCLTVALDDTERVLGVAQTSIGAGDQTFMSPRELLRDALQLGASGIVVAHNHPSGDPEPSRDDEQVTARLKAAGRVAGIPVKDHLVFGTADRWVSIEQRTATAARTTGDAREHRTTYSPAPLPPAPTPPAAVTGLSRPPAMRRRRPARTGRTR